MKKFAIGLFALMFVLASSAFATIRYVSTTGAGGYTVINTALTAAVSGDTILIGPGSYTISTQINEVKRYTVIGAGWDQTLITMTQDWYLNNSNRHSFEGMYSNSNSSFNIFNTVDSTTFRRCRINETVNTSSILWTLGRSLTLEDCIFTAAYTSSSVWQVLISQSNFPTTIRNCVFANTGTSGAMKAIGGYATSGTVELYNSDFLNFQIPLVLNTAGAPLIAINNVFHDWMASPSYGSYNAISTWDYNASTTLIPPGTNALLLAGDPFVNYDETANYVHGTTDLHLDPTNGAACINSGHPSLLDFTDGSQSDRGVYGGPKPLVDNGIPNYPWAVNILLNPNLVGVGTPVNATATGRVGPQY
ncbi:MAG: hypothetical protein IPP40_17490 [bacterium]|nr:hypothetical protein [bacterium]